MLFTSLILLYLVHRNTWHHVFPSEPRPIQTQWGKIKQKERKKYFSWEITMKKVYTSLKKHVFMLDSSVNSKKADWQNRFPGPLIKWNNCAILLEYNRNWKCRNAHFLSTYYIYQMTQEQRKTDGFLCFLASKVFQLFFGARKQHNSVNHMNMFCIKAQMDNSTERLHGQREPSHV